MLSDFGLALRILRRRPHTAAFAAVTLALGIAATVGIFTVTRAVLLRDLPYPDADRLVLVWRGTTNDPDRRGALSPPDVLDLREQAIVFRALAAVNSFSTTYVPDAGDPEQVQLGVVSGDVFRTLGVRPLLGRALESADDRPLDTRDSTTTSVLVLDHAFWRSRFGADSSVLGRVMRLGGSRSRIVGVLPEGVALHMPAGAGMSTDLVGWTPLAIDAAAAPRDGAYLKVIARLTHDVSVGQAQAELDGIAARLRDQVSVHRDTGFRLRVVPMHRDVVAHVRPILLLLTGCGIVVLLVACANAGALLLVRFLGRRREVAVRTALGARRGRVARALLIEAGLIATVGTAAGTLLALPAVDGLLRLEPGIVPRTGAIGIDAAVWLLAAGMALGATLLAGLVPALLATRDAEAPLLRQARTTTPARGVQRALIVAQVAAAFVLLYGGASVLDTVRRLERTDVGFRVANTETFRLTLPFARYRGPDAWVAFFEPLRARLASLPGVSAVGLTSDLPMGGTRSLEPFAPVTAVGRTWGTQTALHQIVSPGYFAAAGITLREGRDFTDADDNGSVPVAVIDDALARRLAAEEPAPLVGRRLDVTAHEFRAGYQVTRRAVEIIGVVSTAAHEHPDAHPPGTIYLSLAQHPLWSMAVLLHGGGASLAAARRAIGDIDPELPLVRPGPFAAVRDAPLAPTRFVLALTTAFALVAIGLAAAGLYGLLADAVHQRRREFGIRLAVGAEPHALTGHVLLGGLALAVAGVVPGVLLVPAVSRVIAGAVTATGGMSLPAIGAAAAAVLGVAAAACYGPARRAGRVDPLIILREE